MSFLHPALLLALPAVFIPLVIHLLHRRRFRKKAWGAMRFLREALEEKRGRRRLRHWVILAMRTLAIATLILAMSRPLAGGWLAGWFGGGDRTVLILMDRSASMERRLNANGAGKRETALGMLTEACRELSPSELWVLDSASGEIRLMDDARELSRSLTATATAADVPAMLRRALEHWEETGQTTGEIWVVSDLQSTSWQAERNDVWADLEAAYGRLATPPGIRLLTLPGGQANRSIRCETKRRHLEVSIRQESGSAEETALPLTLRLDEQKTIHEVRLTGEVSRVMLELPGEGALTGSVSLPDDGNPEDNQAYFAVAPHDRPRVITVCEDPAVAAVLGLAVAPWPEGTAGMAEIERLEPDEVDGHAWGEEVFVIWQGALPAGEAKAGLQGVVESGGQVLFFPGTAVEPENVGRVSWNGVRFGGVKTREEGETAWGIREWTRDEGPLRDTSTGEVLPLSQWMTQRYVPVHLEAGAAVRATFDSGDAGLVLQSAAAGMGAVHFCATLPHPQWSTLGDGLVLVPLVQRLLAAGVRGRSPVTWSAPVGDPWQAGVWEEEGGVWEVMVRPEEEDASAELAESRLRVLMGGMPYQQFALEAGAAGEAQALSDWWRPFFFLALLFLLGESILTMMPRGSASSPVTLS